MAGRGGIGGMVYGETDELSYNGVPNGGLVHDIQATILDKLDMVRGAKLQASGPALSAHKRQRQGRESHSDLTPVMKNGAPFMGHRS